MPERVAHLSFAPRTLGADGTLQLCAGILSARHGDFDVGDDEIKVDGHVGYACFDFLIASSNAFCSGMVDAGRSPIRLR